MATLYLTLLVVLLGAIQDVSGAGALGEACLTGNTCSDPPNLVCESNMCLYKVGVTCTSDNTKCVSHATCATTSAQCICATTYSNNGGLCAGDNRYGGACTAPAGGPDSCVANDANSKCSQASGGTCVCKTYYSGSIGAMCAVSPNTYGGTCTAPVGGADSCVANDANSKCSGTSGTCVCKTGYSGSIGAMCAVPPNTYGGACTAPVGGADSCVANDANSKCSGNSGTCGCKTGYSGSIGTLCAVPLNTYGGACTAPAGGTDSCVANDANSKCSGISGTCVCKTGYSGSIGAKCAGDNKYGGTCTAPSGGTDSCVANDANSKCSGTTGTCECKPGFTASIGTLCSGAMGIASSIILLISALLIKVHLV